MSKSLLPNDRGYTVPAPRANSTSQNGAAWIALALGLLVVVGSGCSGHSRTRIKLSFSHGFDDGYAHGEDDGYHDGYHEGRALGFDDGADDYHFGFGYDPHPRGFDFDFVLELGIAFSDYDEGYNEGYDEAYHIFFEVGFLEGYLDGYDEGYDS